jgi:hypothetical protein
MHRIGARTEELDHPSIEFEQQRPAPTVGDRKRLVAPLLHDASADQQIGRFTERLGHGFRALERVGDRNRIRRQEEEAGKGREQQDIVTADEADAAPSH